MGTHWIFWTGTAAAVMAAGCRMGPHLEGPQVYPSEFGAPMARVESLREADIGVWQKTGYRVDWPGTLAILQVHRDTRYSALSQDEWDTGIAKVVGMNKVNILDGLGVGDEQLHDSATRADIHDRAPVPVTDSKTGALFVRERWAAAAAGSNLVYVFATKVASDTYWNYWWTVYPLVVPAPFAPAQEQTVQAVAKGFLVDVSTGKIIDTAGAQSTQSRRANPILRTEPLFQLEQTAVREAELRMIQQLAAKLTKLHAAS